MRPNMLLAAVSIEDMSLHVDPVGSRWAWPRWSSSSATLFFVGPDCTISLRRVALLVGLRLAAFALVACMLRPTFVSTTKARQPATVLVLADASGSMAVADGPDGRTRWDEMTEALANAQPAVRVRGRRRARSRWQPGGPSIANPARCRSSMTTCPCGWPRGAFERRDRDRPALDDACGRRTERTSPV